MKPSDYWRSNSDLAHITPPGEEWPERGLEGILPVICTGRVFEFGCGYGRLASLFSPNRYVGMDINPAALVSAWDRNPQHSFTTSWTPAHTVLAYTVLLHIPDDEIKEVVGRMQEYSRIVIGEVMGRRWRRPGNPPVFNRSAGEYAEMIGRPYTTQLVEYPRYKTHLTLLAFE